MAYRNAVLVPNVDLLTEWTLIGDFYWPDPTKVSMWDTTTQTFHKFPNASYADLPDHFHWPKAYVEKQTAPLGLVFVNL